MKFRGKKIFIGKEPNELDRFVFDFLDILQKHTEYVVVSGYVAIILGRVRGTEDIDVIIQKKEKEEFEKLAGELFGQGYWCINPGDIAELFDLLKTGHSIRMAKKDQISPNFEVKFASSEADFESLNNPLEAHIKDRMLRIAPLELQVAYKEVVLKSEKDMEDARHIRIVAKDYVDKKKIDAYKKRLKLWMQKG